MHVLWELIESNKIHCIIKKAELLKKCLIVAMKHIMVVQ